MRRHLLAAFAVAFFLSILSASAVVFAQGEGGWSPNPYRSQDRGWNDDYRPGPAPGPYVRPYPQPYGAPYEQQQAQRYGGPGLRILEAWYGRERRVCDAAPAMRGACEGRAGCTVKAGNELCGDPLPRVVKGLSVTYRCHGQTRHVDEMETRHLNLRCD